MDAILTHLFGYTDEELDILEIVDNQEKIDNTIYRAICSIAGKTIPWDIELIGDLRDCIIEALDEIGIAVDY